MQFQNLIVALSLSSAALGAAVNNLSSGLAIRAPGAPVAASLSVVQSPSEVVKRDMEKRGSGHFFVCTDSFFHGNCQNLQFTTGVCNNLGGSFQDTISSAGPDKGFTCTVWQDFDCNGPSVSFSNPGIQDFGTVSPGVNDKISSYRCS